MISSDILSQIKSIVKDKPPQTVDVFLAELEILASPEVRERIDRDFRELDKEDRHTVKMLEKDPSPLSRQILDDRKKGQGKKSLTRGRPRNLAEEVTVLNVVTLYQSCFCLPRKSHEDPCLKILHLLLNTEESPWHSFLKAISDLS
ncbi:MAG: hypothetical protein M1297_07245 [Nitrospirae bacterium]|jgi:ribosomal protein L16 Arg81 hydroxylase|nr:hypothetical protein [Nitrospirota bacterium]